MLLNAVEQAAGAGFDAHAWQLAGCLCDFLDWSGHWHNNVAVQRTALVAAQRQADQFAQSKAHRSLGNAYSAVGRFDEAREQYQQAVDRSATLHDHRGQAYVYLNLSWLGQRQGDYREALRHAESAHELFRTAGDRAGLGRALNVVGWLYAQLGDHRQAVTCCQDALATLDGIGDVAGVAGTWDSLGYCHHHLGDQRQAITCYQRALAMYDRSENPAGPRGDAGPARRRLPRDSRR